MIDREALHPEELALLRAVCAEPDDDTPRLVLADWYQETGQQVLVAFGEFIRQHVADTRVHQRRHRNDADDPSKYLAWFGVVEAGAGAAAPARHLPHSG
jgi:uncharacterized protein (TIGR02996 family)